MSDQSSRSHVGEAGPQSVVRRLARVLGVVLVTVGVAFKLVDIVGGGVLPLAERVFSGLWLIVAGVVFLVVSRALGAPHRTSDREPPPDSREGLGSRGP